MGKQRHREDELLAQGHIQTEMGLEPRPFGSGVCALKGLEKVRPSSILDMQRQM